MQSHDFKWNKFVWKFRLIILRCFNTFVFNDFTKNTYVVHIFGAYYLVMLTCN